MAFGRPMRGVCAAVLASAVLCSLAGAWLAPIVPKGNKFFDADTGDEFRVKGMAYYPRPNAGKLSTVDNYDWAADEHEDVWKPHLKTLKDLGVNTLRLYSVDPSKKHGKFMCACSDAGIYVLVGMAAPCENCSILDALPPKCYPDEMFTRAQMVYNAFAIYDNTLGFSVGNENNLQRSKQAGGTQTAPCVKALLRDTRNYAASCASGLRQVPIGLDNADIQPRETFLSYYDCSVDDNEFTRAEWLGYNQYVECDPATHTQYAQSPGLKMLMKEYSSAQYPRPLMFGEFGCNLGKNTVDGYENQRTFYDAKWMNQEKEMTAEIVGGNVFEFVTELHNTVAKKVSKAADTGRYGMGYFSPDNCDHDKVPCEFNKYPEYDNLKKAYSAETSSTVTFDSYTPERTAILECPKNVTADLPPLPKVKTLTCAKTQPTCNGETSNQVGKTTDNVALGDKKTPSNEVTAAEEAAAGSSSAATTCFSATTWGTAMGVIVLVVLA
ncbi:1,3-beta-glucanosyltransferase [Phytophthora ramorum]|uniref:1,3-beta-glucanosyltransferase n=1 Tax=Phytophthora ramorum TaxID=164328 RepID=UPI0030A6F833|nr:1,3-beta-glucanosyltransferase [Phytophthora ramorum]